MSDYIVKVTKTEGQTRITIPRMLAEESHLRYIDIVKLTKIKPGVVLIEEYHGKESKKRGLQKNPA